MNFWHEVFKKQFCQMLCDDYIFVVVFLASTNHTIQPLVARNRGNSIAATSEAI